MKTVYEKPAIFFESFSLSTNIAGDCEIRTNTPSQRTCAYTYQDEFLGKLELFDGEIVKACKDTAAEGEYDGICYHTYADNSLFNS